MGKHRTAEKVKEIAKFVGATLLFAYAILFFYINIVQGQSTLRDVPIVSDKSVTVIDSTMRVVDKDEHQRIINKLVKRIQKLEDEVQLLRAEINLLKEQTQGE